MLSSAFEYPSTLRFLGCLPLQPCVVPADVDLCTSAFDDEARAVKKKPPGAKNENVTI